MKIFIWKIAATPRRRKGPPKRRLLLLGELGDNGGGHSSPPRRSIAHLGGCRLLLGIPAMVQGLCLRPVSGRSRGLVCDYCGLLRGPLCDLF